MKKTFPGVIFANSNIPEKCFWVCLGEDEISELLISESSEGKYAVPDKFCFAEFLRYYYLPSNSKYKENNYQQEELDDALLEDVSNIGYIYPIDIKLLSKKP